MTTISKRKIFDIVVFYAIFSSQIRKEQFYLICQGLNHARLRHYYFLEFIKKLIRAAQKDSK